MFTGNVKYGIKCSIKSVNLCKNKNFDDIFATYTDILPTIMVSAHKFPLIIKFCCIFATCKT